MYQFERSSTNDSNARITSTVSVASYAVGRLGDELLRPRDEPAVERPQVGRPARAAASDGSKPSMFA